MRLETTCKKVAPPCAKDLTDNDIKMPVINLVLRSKVHSPIAQSHKEVMAEKDKTKRSDSIIEKDIKKEDKSLKIKEVEKKDEKIKENEKSKSIKKDNKTSEKVEKKIGNFIKMYYGCKFT